VKYRRTRASFFRFAKGLSTKVFAVLFRAIYPEYRALERSTEGGHGLVSQWRTFGPSRPPGFLDECAASSFCGRRPTVSSGRRSRI
jgi:hypothetical protein